MQVSMDKKYRTTDGKKVRILCTDLCSNNGRNVLAAVKDPHGYETVLPFEKDGRYGTDENPLNLVECTPWDDFKTNDAVMATKDGSHWFRANFAGTFLNSSSILSPSVFKDGKTRWTSCVDPIDNGLPWGSAVEYVVDVVQADAFPIGRMAQEEYVDVEIRLEKEAMEEMNKMAELRGVSPEQFVILALDTYLQSENKGL